MQSATGNRKHTGKPAIRKAVWNRLAGRHLAGVCLELVILRVEADKLQVWLEQKEGPPSGSGPWKLPGNLLPSVASLDGEASRRLKPWWGNRPPYLEQLYTFGKRPLPGRGSGIAVTYLALVGPGAEGGHGPGGWFPVEKLPPLSRGARQVIGYALERLRSKIQYTPAVFHLLPPQFSLSELQTTYERILGRPLDKRNFRKKFLSLNILASNGQTAPRLGRRPARLYSYLYRRGATRRSSREKNILFSF